jgi:TPR repeat protein
LHFAVEWAYQIGMGVPQDYVEALKWLGKAADRGEVAAQISVRHIYGNGSGVPENYAEALKWFRKAADQGAPSAQFDVGLIYRDGRGVPQDYAEALKWLRKAADQRNADAQYSLGIMYYNGQSVPPNYVQAHMWFSVAASNPASKKERYGQAVHDRDVVARKLTSAQLAQAQTMSQQCLRSNYADCGLLQVARRENKVASPPTTESKVRRTTIPNTGSYEDAIAANLRRDHAAAVRILRPLADQGYSRAQWRLGLMLYQGQGVAKSEAEAAKGYRKAAEQGLADAHRSRGIVLPWLWCSAELRRGDEVVPESRTAGQRLLTEKSRRNL